MPVRRIPLPLRPVLLSPALVVLLLAALVAVLFVVPVPYVSLVPGPTVDTLGERDGEQVITITGTRTWEPAGEVLFTTVGVLDHRNVALALRGWLDPTVAVVPRTTVYPSDRTREETDERNEQEFAASEQAAEVAALAYLGHPGKVVVSEVVAGGPSDGVLVAGDVITAVDGEPVGTSTDLVAAVGGTEPGATLVVAYERGGLPATAEIVTAAGEGPHRSVIGVVVEDASTAPFEVTYGVTEVGGPSAGLMLAVGTVDLLTEDDLSGGGVVAGTGTISPEGVVGPIGGVRQKVVAAREAGATVFLLPPRDCAEALLTVPDGLRLVPVDTLTEAVDALRALRDDPAADVPRCPA